MKLLSAHDLYCHHGLTAHDGQWWYFNVGYTYMYIHVVGTDYYTQWSMMVFGPTQQVYYRLLWQSVIAFD